MHLETERPSKLRVLRGGHDWASLKMQLEAEIQWTERCTWKLWLSEFGDALGGQGQVNSEWHFEVVIECVGTYTWRPWWIKIRGVLGGCWSGVDWSEGGQFRSSQSETSQFEGGRLRGMRYGSGDSIHCLTFNCGTVENSVQQGLQSADRLAGSVRLLILKWCSKRCMQYSRYVVLSICCTQC